MKKLAERMKTTMHSMLQSTGMDMSFVLISILHDDISVTYFVPSNDYADKVITWFFQIFKGFCYTNFIMTLL